MAKATIRTKSGTEITVEGDVEAIKDIITTIQRRDELKEHSKEEFIRRRNEIVHDKQKPLNATETILKLKHEGFFKERRAIGAIQGELEKHGHIYPQTSLSGILIRLVRKGELGRVREERGWGYVQR
jgi:hypothetical protein